MLKLSLMMCDPFLIQMPMQALGDRRVAWHTADRVRHVRPGHGTLTVHIQIPAEETGEMRACVDRGGKAEPLLRIGMADEDDQVVARIEKPLRVRRKDSRDD